MVRKAIARTISLRSIERSKVRRPTGVIIAAPQPWKIRAATNWGRVLDRPQKIEPMVKTAMAERNTRLVPKRSAAQPEAGMKTAWARR